MVGTDMIVLPKPLIDDDLSLCDCGKPLGIEHFSTQGALLIPADLHAVVTSTPPASSTSTWRKTFRQSSSE